MATFSKKLLSASSDGRGIKVGALTSPGTTIHVGSSTATTIDEVWLYAVNTDSVSRTLTVQWGGTTSPDDSISLLLGGSETGMVLVVPGLLIKGNSSSALEIKAFADSANKIVVHGYVNQITV